MRNDILEKKDFILDLISNKTPKAEICRLLKCKEITLDSYLKKFGVEYKGNMGAKGHKISNYKKSAMYYIENKISITSHKLRIKILEEGIKESICESCKRTEWLNQPIPLELHHINGEKFDNDLKNLQILCPNCHATTENYSGKKVKKD